MAIVSAGYSCGARRTILPCVVGIGRRIASGVHGERLKEQTEMNEAEVLERLNDTKDGFPWLSIVRSTYVAKDACRHHRNFSITVLWVPLRSSLHDLAVPLTYTNYQQNLLFRRSKFRLRTNISNRLNLDGHALGQLLDRDAATRRLVGKVLLEHAVHLGKVGHVVQEDVNLRVTRTSACRSWGRQGKRAAYLDHARDIRPCLL
jgi:hypothetical protein